MRLDEAESLVDAALARGRDRGAKLIRAEMEAEVAAALAGEVAAEAAAERYAAWLDADVGRKCTHPPWLDLLAADRRLEERQVIPISISISISGCR